MSAIFSRSRCKFWFQLKGQKTRIGASITDGAYSAMMNAIRNDELPSFYFLHYDAASWTVRNLLLVPHFAFPPSAIIQRPPLSATARRAGWVGCNFALDRIPVDARIPLVTTIRPRHDGDTECVMVSPPEVVRAKFRQVKPLKEISVKQRGWTLDVLNIVRRLTERRRRGLPRHTWLKSLTKKTSQRFLTSSPTDEFTNTDIYAYERELAALHPDNRHIRDKIRQQLQVLRDTGFLTQPERGMWRVK